MLDYSAPSIQVNGGAGCRKVHMQMRQDRCNPNALRWQGREREVEVPARTESVRAPLEVGFLDIFCR